MKIEINWSMCDGNGYCAKEAPELLSLDDNDTPQILKPSFGEDQRKNAEAAVRVCPKHALRLVE